MKKTLHTKWGTININSHGYYVITSRKEGNRNKSLHRLIFEDFYGKIPDGCVIHHKDGDKTNNCIMNLQLLTDKEHKRLHNKDKNHHMYGKHHSEETCRKTSKTMNTTGYYRVTKNKDKKCKQGFIWVYRYYDKNGKQKPISSVDLNKLEEKVKKRGLPWYKIGDDFYKLHLFHYL